MEFLFKRCWGYRNFTCVTGETGQVIEREMHWVSLYRQITSELWNPLSWKYLGKYNLSCCCTSLCISLWSLLLTRFWVGWVLCLHQNGHCMFQDILCPSSFSSEPWLLSLYPVKSVSFSSLFSGRKQFNSFLFWSPALVYLCFYGNSA